MLKLRLQNTGQMTSLDIKRHGKESRN
jgi:hypothetical protein